MGTDLGGERILCVCVSYQEGALYTWLGHTRKYLARLIANKPLLVYIAVGNPLLLMTWASAATRGIACK